MDFVGAIQSGFRKYAIFGGVAKRPEYWYWTLFTVLASLVAVALDMILGIGVLSNLFSLGSLLPTLAVTVRRLRDSGKSWVWLLSPLPGFTVLIAGLVMLVTNLFVQGYITSADVLQDDNFPSDALLDQIFSDPTFLPGLGVFIIGVLLTSVFQILVNIIFMVLPSRSFEQGNKRVPPTL